MDLIEQCMSGDLQGRVFLAFISITVLLVAHRVLKVIKSFRFFRSLPQEENFSYIWGNLQNVSLMRLTSFLKDDVNFHRFLQDSSRTGVIKDTSRGDIKTAQLLK